MNPAPVSKVLKGRRVLIVEDEFLIAEEMRRAVDGLGGGVLGPVGALEDAERLLGEGRPDLALLDVNLHGRMVNPVAAQLKRLKVPMIFATGYAQSNLAPEFQGDLYLEKPVTSHALAAAVEKLGNG